MGGRPNASAGVALGKRLVLVSSEALHELAETDILRRSAWSWELRPAVYNTGCSRIGR